MSQNGDVLHLLVHVLHRALPSRPLVLAAATRELGPSVPSSAEPVYPSWVRLCRDAYDLVWLEELRALSV